MGDFKQQAGCRGTNTAQNEKFRRKVEGVHYEIVGIDCKWKNKKNKVYRKRQKYLRPYFRKENNLVSSVILIVWWNIWM